MQTAMSTRVLITGIAALFLAMPAFAEPINPADIWVLDADTIQVYHQHALSLLPETAQRYRL